MAKKLTAKEHKLYSEAKWEVFNDFEKHFKKALRAVKKEGVTLNKHTVRVDPVKETRLATFEEIASNMKKFKKHITSGGLI